MTNVRRDGNDSPFGNWIRSQSELDSIQDRLAVIDRDWWIHQYRAHHDQVGARAIDSIMLLEEKTHSARSGFAQRDTLFLVDQLLKRSDNRIGYRSYRRLNGPSGEKRIVRCFGVCSLIMSGVRPDDSEWMLWNGVKIDERVLVELLRFDRDPHCPNKKLEYRRHHIPSSQQKQAQLFRIVE